MFFACVFLEGKQNMTLRNPKTLELIWISSKAKMFLAVTSRWLAMMAQDRCELASCYGEFSCLDLLSPLTSKSQLIKQFFFYVVGIWCEGSPLSFAMPVSCTFQDQQTHNDCIVVSLFFCLSHQSPPVQRFQLITWQSCLLTLSPRDSGRMKIIHQALNCCHISSDSTYFLK